MKKITVLLMITLFWAGATHAADGVVSLNFESWGSVPPAAYAGVVSVNNWNDTWLEGNPAPNPMVNINDNLNVATTIDVSWVSGTWGIRLYDSTASGADVAGTRNVSLMKGYLDKHAPAMTSFTVTEIPYSYYDVYVYVMADVANRAGNVTDGKTTYYFLTDPASVHFTAGGSADYVEFKEITATEAGNAVLSNYAVFHALSGDTQTIDCAITNGGGIAGFQIVEVGPPTGPSEPVVTPVNDDGTVGDIADMGGGNWQIQNVVLNFIAAKDPNELHVPQYTINPDILQHNIWLQTGAPDDPNLYLYDNVAANIADPYTHDPNVSYGPLPSNLLKQATVYQWQVEEVLKDPNGNPYGDGDPNNIFGPVWSFTTASATPEIISISDHTLTDVNGDAAFTIESGPVANNYRWFKVVGVQDTEGGEADDIKLADGVLYSGTQTTTLTITGMATNGSDDAQYYAIAYNGDPEGAGVASPPSAVRWVWYPRETSRYAFEDMDTSVDANGITTDSISGYNMAMKSNDTGGDGPVLDSNAYVGSSSLFLNNPRANPADPNNGDAQYAQISAPYVGTYKDITISTWVYFKGGNWSRIIDLGNSAGNSTFITAAYNNTPGNLRFAVDTPSAGEQNVSSAGAVPLNEWVCITATLTGNTGKIFVNGEYIAQNTNITHDPVENGATTRNYLGRSQYNDAYFDGYIDELRIWNYGLTTDQVAQAYLADSGAEYVCDVQAGNLQYDYNDNCIVDLGDLAEIASEWLDSYRFYRAP